MAMWVRTGAEISDRRDQHYEGVQWNISALLGNAGVKFPEQKLCNTGMVPKSF